MANINWIVNYPKIQTINIFDVDVTFKTDNDGRIYYVAVPFNDPQPTINQIKVGCDSNNNPVPHGRSGNFTIKMNIEQVRSVSNLQSETTYEIYCVATSTTNDNSLVAIETVFLNAMKRTIQLNALDALQQKSICVANWPRKSTMPKPNNYRETVISRVPISYWRLGESDGELIAIDAARYVNGEYRLSWFDGNSYISSKNKASSSSNIPLQINDHNLSARFTWETDLLYNKQKGTNVRIPHKSKFVGMSTMLLEFFMKVDLPKGKNGTIISKTDALTDNSNVIYREYTRVTNTRNYDVVNYNYVANTPFVFECDFKPEWNCTNDKYIIAFGVDENTDVPVFNYGILNQRLGSYGNVYDSAINSIVQNVKHHLKLVYNGTILQVYLDETLVNSRTISIASASQIRIGNYHNKTSINDTDWFVGEMWNMRLIMNPIINPAFHVEMDNGRLKAIVGNGTSTISVLSSTVIADQNWHYVIVLFKNRVLKIYIDNILVGTSPALSSDFIYPTNESSIEIAGTSNQALWPFFQGWIDEMAIYDRDWYSS